MKSLQSLFDSIDYNIKRLNNDVQGQLSVFIFFKSVNNSWPIPHESWGTLGPKVGGLSTEIIQTKTV